MFVTGGAANILNPSNYDFHDSPLWACNRWLLWGNGDNRAEDSIRKMDSDLKF